MSLTLEMVYDLLTEAGLLKEFITPAGWHMERAKLPQLSFSKLSYDSRQTDSETLFFCKGLNFKEEYLQGALAQGLQVYLADQPYETDAACALITTDIRKAMAVISMAFYRYPQEKLKIVAFTGTKGKTTAAYFTHGILQEATGGKTALLSTMNTTLDGKSFFKSHLTTPESLDLYQMMAEAVANGMTHLVMEVSSQAYKTQRVYGLQYDVGIFLNISPDHISPIEHPTFDDYFYCKRQLLAHSKVMILDADMDYFDLVAETCERLGTPTYTYGRNAGDYRVTTNAKNQNEFYVENRVDPLKITGNYRIKLAGDFNQDNATAAIIAAVLLGATTEDAYRALSEVLVPGRMVLLQTPLGATVYIDYAHNYISLKLLLEFAKKQSQGRVLVVLGSPGNKALSRRQDFGQVLSELADIAILTADDPAFEDPKDIADEIAAAITNPEVLLHFEMDRRQAIRQALTMSQPDDVVIIAGKGLDPQQKVQGVDVFYEGDYTIAKEWIDEQN
ncbi:UDP-N-acetylmuramyl-tripeptide synthetase [Enterococcus asini ATCC 700915]|uniref:UDP-N-acetylmuramoyl-L-alanyl-D-glutamate--L-lysine ligase n=1 Tax=Enterococcus asini ATCC 700915 TaxID=1158606 RepID=R2SBX0_9ENTE|nr:UDP-N-acetylmuramoyl-L-alanyl-D-glutamate--L-lysine ligase [Enterococcus asini]EOH90336.1 UDP-N-acetylmuramyl-tripeptide synthetase [Enterococcus asini ATCC 700915]EOT57032.1 UDP-N-acetylmuramoylalanyl-D-glutamate-L- lysine ligase [Enterococcus asini ATCC 700915]